MQEAPLPPDGDDGNGDQPRRAGLRLRDAESVATTRRDMFGDGSLIDTLAGTPSAQEDAPSPPESGLPGAGAPESGPPVSSAPDAPLPEGPESPQPAAADAADRAASQRVARKRPEPRIVNPAASPFAQVPQSLDSIIDSFAPEPGSQGAEPPADEPAEPTPPPPLLPPTRMAVSSIFDTLGAAPAHTEGAQAVDEVSPPGAFAPDMSMLGPPLPRSAQAAADATPEPTPGDAAPDFGAPVHATDGPELDAAGGDAELPQPPAPDFGRPPLRLVVSAPYPELPPMPEPPQPSLEAVDAPPPDPALPELPELPSFAEAPEPAIAPRSAEPLAGPRLSVSPEALHNPRSLEPVVTTVVPEPLVTTVVPESPDDAGRPMFEAAAKIAAEATATAEALDNLKHLLGHDAAGTDEPVRPPGMDGPPLNLLGDPAQFTLRQRAPLLPLPVPPERAGVKGVYLLGFLTGLGLAVMAGIALYVLITLG